MHRDLISWADRSAIFLSSLCVIHCLILPIVLVAMPALTSVAFFSDEKFHTWLLFGVIPISVVAVGFGYFHHHSKGVVVVASVGISILVLVAVMGHEAFGESGEVIWSVIGSGFVAFAHLRNLHRRRYINRCTRAEVKAPT